MCSSKPRTHQLSDPRAFLGRPTRCRGRPSTPTPALWCLEWKPGCQSCPPPPRSRHCLLSSSSVEGSQSRGPPQEDLQSPFCLPPASLRSGTWGQGALLLSARGLCLSPAHPGPLTSRNGLPSHPLRTVCPCLKEAPACAAGRLCRPVTRAPRPAASTVLGPRH